LKRVRRATGDRVRDVVVLDPGETWLRVEDTAALLSVTPATVRAAISRGELAGRRERGGRWRVRLESVLGHPRCNPGAVARFGGKALPIEERASDIPVGRLSRDVFARLDAAEAELLERARARHGTIRAAIVAGLRALDEDDTQPGEVAELRVAHDLYRDEAEQARNRAAVFADLFRRRAVDVLYCPVCEKLVPLDQAGYEVEPDGTVAIYHEPHGYRAGSRVRASTVMARRLPPPADAIAS
jgi:hypothetical protein